MDKYANDGARHEGFYTINWPQVKGKLFQRQEANLHYIKGPDNLS